MSLNSFSFNFTVLYLSGDNPPLLFLQQICALKKKEENIKGAPLEPDAYSAMQTTC